MGSIHYYVDEHVGTAVVRGLRQRGIAVTTVVEAETRSATDEEHLAFAQARGLVVFTQDADFLKLHAAGVPHAGIVYAPQQTSVGRCIHGLTLIARVLETEEISGRVGFL